MVTVEERYREKFAGSIPWHEDGKSVFAGGVTHQTRFVSPFAIYIDHASGPFKYDVDGNELIDYVMGSGSLLMGHSPPEITEAVARAANARNAPGRGIHARSPICSGSEKPHAFHRADPVHLLGY